MTASITSLESVRRKTIAPELYAPVLLVPGEYELAYISHRVTKQFNRGTLALYFQVLEFDETVIVRHFNVALTGSGKSRSFRPAPQSALVRDFRRLFTQRIGRLDRFPLHLLKDRSVIGDIGTVTEDHEQKQLDETSQYSVVRKLLRCV